ncbi:hypothetical protein [Pontibacter sp. HSC-36F09]|uniref:hypothetical protein n=1 Tax=Pontibacter sp. HSC-36F09 TaxID=2910966 RepID=UPI0020A1B621|nr:hypothetical protein [Pontibacter sp. HSC-36F09]MCP2042167.1 hypothetical protein [Pontibacter sp. HSC-36F09]
MYSGEPSKGLEFYNLLIQSDEFTSELGRVTLASGRLETELIAFLRHKGIEGKNKKLTLGTLIRIAQENQALDINMINALQQVSEKRNYLTHNIYALFSDMIDETILEKENLLVSDVHLYLERAWQLKENLNELTDILRQENK